jgi:hypothetical protein
MSEPILFQQYNVQYEGLHIICGGCGCYGHHTRDCVKVPSNNLTAVHKTSQHGGRAEDSLSSKVTVAAESVKENLVKTFDTDPGKVTESEIIKEVHGDWLVVQRKKRNKKVNLSQPTSLPIKEVHEDLKGVELLGIHATSPGKGAYTLILKTVAVLPSAWIRRP